MNAEKPNRQSITQVVVLGGGFAGIYAVRRLEKLFGGRDDVQITLVSRDNFLLMTPLLFEVCSGKLEMSACSISIREFCAGSTLSKRRLKLLTWIDIWSSSLQGPPSSENYHTTTWSWPWGA